MSLQRCYPQSYAERNYNSMCVNKDPGVEDNYRGGEGARVVASRECL